MRGRRPSNSANLLASSLAFSNDGSFFISLLYTPLNDLICALCLPYTFSKASLISPKVALSRAALIAKSNKFFSPDWADFVNFNNALFTLTESRVNLILFNRSI